jgi:hypothetical protein
MITFHPLAELFPLLGDDELEEMIEDIRANGIRDPIDLLDDSILDGRNRYRALVTLRVRGLPCGTGWGSLEGEPLSDEELEPAPDVPWFRRYSPMESGDPLKYVLSKNLKRRHLSDTQRASVAAKIANLGVGRPETIPPDGGISTAEAAETLNVSTRQVERARVVHAQGVPELRQALDEDKMPVATAEKIARMPEDQQRAAVEQATMPSNARAVMASRQEAPDSLDYFPTPPWATRALLEDVLPRLGIDRLGSVWEPACGEGHMAEVLREYFGDVFASDVYNYGYGDPDDGVVIDFLSPDAPKQAGTEEIGGEGDDPFDWIITNPPFEEKALAFALRAIELAEVGVAIFVPLRWLETIERYERLFKPMPPTQVAFFVERVNLCKGRWEPDGSTATSYVWLVWLRDREPRPPFWIPPGRRAARSRPYDAERFTQQPVARLPRPFLVVAEGTDIDPAEIGKPDGILYAALPGPVTVGIDFGSPEGDRSVAIAHDPTTGEIFEVDPETGEILDSTDAPRARAEAGDEKDESGSPAAAPPPSPPSNEIEESYEVQSEPPPAADPEPPASGIAAQGEQAGAESNPGGGHEVAPESGVTGKHPGEAAENSPPVAAVVPTTAASPTIIGPPTKREAAHNAFARATGLTPDQRGVPPGQPGNEDGLDIPPFMRRKK